MVKLDGVRLCMRVWGKGRVLSTGFQAFVLIISIDFSRLMQNHLRHGME